MGAHRKNDIRPIHRWRMPYILNYDEIKPLRPFVCPVLITRNLLKRTVLHPHESDTAFLVAIVDARFRRRSDFALGWQRPGSKLARSKNLLVSVYVRSRPPTGDVSSERTDERSQQYRRMTSDIRVVKLLSTAKAERENRRTAVCILIGDFNKHVFVNARHFSSPGKRVLLLGFFQQFEHRCIRFTVNGGFKIKGRAYPVGIVGTQTRSVLIPHQKRILGSRLLNIVDRVFSQKGTIRTLHHKRHAGIGFQIRSVVPPFIKDQRNHP